jgi:tetratricopeptide (TPR) repeat protein
MDHFTARVPVIPGVLPDHGVWSLEEYEKRGLSLPIGLIARPGENIHIGFRYEDRDGREQWMTTSAKVVTHPVFDVMEEDWRTPKEYAYVGENLYLRVVDLGADVSDSSDTTSVVLQARSGAKYTVDLLEVDTHSGVFKGSLLLTYKTDKSPAIDGGPEEPYDVKKSGFPVVYGDEVRTIYADANGTKSDIHAITIKMGADGTIEPFSKVYEDAETAMRTQFALAESYLEMAKRHRKLGEHDLAAREYDRAKQMLASAVDQFRDPETRAHAEYLLGQLTQAEASSTADAAVREDRFRAALSRYMKVTGSYPDTLHAARAQFKIATVFEALHEPEIAAQEYVKLAYKYPDSEHLGLSMARLGTHFLRTASRYEAKAKPLLAKTEDRDAQFDGEALKKMAVREYLKSANIFARLLERFPEHELAGKAGLRAGQAYMRAGEKSMAVFTLLKVVNNESFDGADVRAPAMYWAGTTYQELNDLMAAYSMFKRLTYDFPETKWAAFARGRLSEESLLKLETQLEIQRIEEGR